MAGREIDPQFDASALVIIDTQRDVLDDGALPIAGTSAALPAMRRVLEAFRYAGRPIVHVVRKASERDFRVVSCMTRSPGFTNAGSGSWLALGCG